MEERIVLRAENISKMYRLGLVNSRSLTADLNRWWHVVRGKEDPYLKIGEVNNRAVKGSSDYVWALKDIDFEVNAGDTMAIIGRNGAGKSTLLKLLSRVTQPTTGKIGVEGRIASLLEVGTGFHPELTGRDNIYLNGAILGMRKQEITQKLDQIIDFSGVERYIDTPVKRYSSGMYVRLAFAVAAHLESEILIIDEVLAVGDMEFQKKCLGKMDEVAKGQGRTVLFVSHNMAAVKSLCQKGIVIENGQKVFQGQIGDAVKHYMSKGSESALRRQFDFVKNDQFVLKEITISNDPKDQDDLLLDKHKILIESRFDVLSSEVSHIAYHVLNESGEPIFSMGTGDIALSVGENKITCEIPAYFFQSGTYYLSLFVISKAQKALLIEKDVMSFLVTDGDRLMGTYMGREPGDIRPQFNWYQS
ncbi:MAG: ABC transporter ATP-binding protein [Bacteroidetes bacterium]|nr:ABC transporter ATP-binding protein [Bacteroidota bacterium]